MKTLKQIIAESRELKESLWRRDVEGGKGIVSAYGEEDNDPRTKEEIKNAGPSERDAAEMKGSGKRKLKRKFTGKGRMLIKNLPDIESAVERERPRKKSK